MELEELKRFDRTLAILILLQSKKIVKAGYLAERFGVSLRTIYRDIRSLEAAGVPIVGEAGVGYSIMDGYRLPPVMFTREEAGSFVAAEKLMQKFTDASLGGYFQSAIAKIKAVLRGNEKDWIAALETQVWAAPREELFNKDIPNAMEILFNGIAERKQVYLEYRSFAAEGAKARYIEPVGVFHQNNHWYINGFCHLRNEYRQFRTDRISAIAQTDIPFTREHTDVYEVIPPHPEHPKLRVVLAIDKSAIRYIGDGKKYYGFVSEKDLGDEVEMEFDTPEPAEALARWYLMFGDHARVVSPESFRNQVKKLAEKTLQQLAV